MPLIVTDPQVELDHVAISATSTLRVSFAIEPGSARPEQVNVRLAAEFLVRDFDVDSDGIIGTLGITADVGTAAAPAALRVLGRDRAFADVDGDAAFTPGMDHAFGRVAGWFVLELASVPGAVTQRTTYELELRSSILANPDVPGTGFVDVQISAPCAGLYFDSFGVGVTTGTCRPSGQVAILVRKNGAEIEIGWQEVVSADACTSSYAVLATDAPAAAAPLLRGHFNRKWSDLTTDDRDGSTSDASWRSAPSVGYFLVVAVGPEGERGPVGHYGL
jgi:hypothetical protein